jgi:hypothetical protein
MDMPETSPPSLLRRRGLAVDATRRMDALPSLSRRYVYFPSSRYTCHDDLHIMSVILSFRWGVGVMTPLLHSIVTARVVESD